MGLKSFFQNTENEHSETTPLFGGKRDVIEHEDEYKYALIDSTGNTISDFYDEIESFSDEFALVTNNDTYALMNSDGQILTAWYESIEPFDGYFSLVMNDKDEYSLIDKKGNLVSPWNEDEEMILKILKMRNLELNLAPNNTQNEVIIEQQSMEQKNVAKDAEPINPSLQQEKNDTTHNLKTDSMYNEKIENLINFALADGELTEKEKQILFKKAEEAGIDLDEFEMVLDAKLHEKQQSIKQPVAPATAAPKSDKFGDVKKCPSCGAIVGAFQGICSDCGHEFTNIDSVSSVQNLYKELMRVENEERNRPKKDKKDKPTSLLGSIAGEIDTDDDDDEDRITEIIYKRKISVVSAFPVPNSKADILEFMIMAVAEGGKKIGGFWSNMSDEEKSYIKTWRAKSEQVVGKARFSLKDDKKLLDEINEYARKLEIKK